MAEVVIELMRREHLPAIQEIELQAFSTPWTEEMFVQELENNAFSRPYSALLDGQLVGYMVSWFLKEEVHLLNIAVAEGFRRRGLGSRMLEYLITLCKKEKRELITLEVRESNADAIGLYKAYNFEIFGIRKQYYREDNEDAVLMVRYLPIESWE